MWFKFAYEKYARLIFLASLKDAIGNLNVSNEIKEYLFGLIDEGVPQKIVGKIIEWIKTEQVKNGKTPSFDEVKNRFGEHSERYESQEQNRQKSLERNKQIQENLMRSVQSQLDEWKNIGDEEFQRWLRAMFTTRVYEEYQEFIKNGGEINIRDLFDYFQYEKQMGQNPLRLEFWQLVKASDKWHRDMQNTINPIMYGPLKEENIIYEWDDGYRIVLLDDHRDYNVEGRKMGHCAATHFGRSVLGNSFNFSLRDPQNNPLITFELDRRGKVLQIQGKHNKEPEEPLKKSCLLYTSPSPRDS